MELRTFITQAIEDIVGGVADAQERCKGTNAIISPAKHSDKSDPRILTEIKFSVGVVETDSATGGGGIGVCLGAVSIGGRGEDRAEKKAASNIEFSVPVVLPYEMKPFSYGVEVPEGAQTGQSKPLNQRI